MSDKDFLDSLYENRSEIFPYCPSEGQVQMDLNGRIYVFLENSWAEVEDIKVSYEEKPKTVDDTWKKIMEKHGIENTLE